MWAVVFTIIAGGLIAWNRNSKGSIQADGRVVRSREVPDASKRESQSAAREAEAIARESIAASETIPQSAMTLQLRLQVLDRGNRDPIEGAAVLGTQGDGEVLLDAVSNRDGVATLEEGDVQALAGQTLWISAPGFVTRAMVAADEGWTPADEKVVLLRRAFRLRGVVLEGGSGLPVAGAAVFACPKGVPTGHRTALRSFLRCSAVESCVSDGEGRFQFDSLSPGVHYRMFAAGSGAASVSDDVVFFEPGATEDPEQSLRIAVWPAHGRLIRFIDGGGEQVSIPAWKNDGLSMALTEESAATFEPIPEWLLFAAAGQPELPQAMGSAVTLAFANTDTEGSLPSVSVHWSDSMRGCEQSFELTLPSVIGGIESSFLRLGCSDLSSGAAMVELGLGSVSDRLRNVDLATSLFVVQVQGPGPVLGQLREYEPLLVQGKLRLEGLQSGHNRIAVKPLFAYSGIPAACVSELELPPGQSDVSLDLGGLSWIRVRLRCADESYEGGAGFAVYLMRPEDPGVRDAVEGVLIKHVWFWNAPYLIPVPLGGDYQIQWLGRFDSRDEAVQQAVSVGMGEDIDVLIDY